MSGFVCLFVLATRKIHSFIKKKEKNLSSEPWSIVKMTKRNSQFEGTKLRKAEGRFQKASGQWKLSKDLWRQSEGRRKMFT